VARRAAVPPRTIFTKDVSKIARTPLTAREKIGKKDRAHNMIYK
jgi:hypothetical protein